LVGKQNLQRIGKVMNRTLLNTILILIGITITGWLLVIGRNMLVTFIIAIIVWYVIDMLANAIVENPLGIPVPRWLTILLALIIMVIITFFLIDLVRQNITELAGDAPIYQQRLMTNLQHGLDFVGISDPKALEQYLPELDIPRIITRAASFKGNFASTFSLILVYVLFLLIEESTIDSKFAALFPDGERGRVAVDIRMKIAESIRHYVGIKTGISILTAILSYAVLKFLGVKYAALFALIIFFLNYIPAIGSMIGVIIPGMLALLQFDTPWPFVSVIVLLGSIQFCIGNLLEPRLMGNSLNLSPLVILLSLSFWGSIWGVTGMVLCVPITVSMLIVFAQFEHSRPIAILLSANGDIGMAKAG
jgi:AI-2 transport protein TqsA